MSIEQADGLGPTTIADRLEALDGCNALICLVDPAVEQSSVVVSGEKLAKMPSSALVELLVELLGEGRGGRGAATQWCVITDVLRELITAQHKVYAAAELEVLRKANPYMLRRDIEAAQARGHSKAEARLKLVFPGLADVILIADFDDIGEIPRLAAAEQADGGARSEAGRLLGELQYLLENVVEVQSGGKKKPRPKGGARSPLRSDGGSPLRGSGSPLRGQASPTRTDGGDGVLGFGEEAGPAEPDEDKIELEMKAKLKNLVWLAQLMGQCQEVDEFREQVRNQLLRLDAL
jgi:hypothetical protein